MVSQQKQLSVVSQQKHRDCLACGSSSIESCAIHVGPQYSRDYRYSQCQDCGFIFVNPRPSPEEVEQVYSAHTNPFMQDDYEGVAAELATLVRLVHRLQKMRPSGRLLDMGCGRGDLLRVARDAGYEVQGSDLATTTGPHDDIPIFPGFLKDAHFPSSSFDVIVTRNTLEHVFDPAEELVELNRLLQPRGTLYIKVPHVLYERGWRCRLCFRRGSLFAPPFHLNHFGIDSIRAILAQCGFEIVSWESERPSQSKSRLKNIVQNSGFAMIQAMRQLTFGTVFPKPLLCIIARKVRVPATMSDAEGKHSVPKSESKPVPKLAAS